MNDRRLLSPAYDVQKVDPVTYPATWAGLVIALALFLSLAIGGGFVGADDRHYLQGALRWFDDGAYVPVDHWEARLPYIVSLSAGIALFGPSALGIIAPHALFLFVTLFFCWRMGLLAMGSRGALLSVAVAAATPLFLRSTKTFYPEAMECALAAAAIYTAFAACWRQQSDRRRASMLIGAGLLSGTGILVRQTAVAVPIAISLALMWEMRESKLLVVRSIALIAVGVILPVAIECLYYAVVTGDPLYRFTVDTHHVLIPSGYMTGSVFEQGSPLFNWKLAPLWHPPALFYVHWMVNPLINVFTHPGLSIIPLLGVTGAFHAWQLGGRLRTVSVLALGMLLVQYLINTFVLVVSPNPRYFANSALVLCLSAASLLMTVRPTIRMLLLSVVVLSSATMAMASFNPESLVASLKIFVSKEPVVYVSPEVAATAQLAAMTDSDLATKQRIGPAPVDAAAAIGWLGGDRRVLSELCETGQPRWQILDSGVDVHSIPWKILNAFGLLGVIPGSIERYLSREGEAITLARRRC